MINKIGLWVTAGISIATISLGLSRLYNRWKGQQLGRLQTDSQLLETPLGPIEYQEEGDISAPAVMVLHGSPGGYDQSRAFMHALGIRGFRMLYVSRPGYLRTPVSSGVSFEEQADLYAALLKELHIEKVMMIAISGGGPSALQFALRHPNRCCGLIMLSALTQSSTLEMIYRTMSWSQSLRFRLFNALSAYDPVVYLMLIKARWQAAKHELQEKLELTSALSFQSMRKPGYMNDVRLFAHIPAYPLQHITTPTLILHGMNDADVPLTQAEFMMTKIPQARLLAFEGDHFFMLAQENRETVSSAMLAFLHTFEQVPLDTTDRDNTIAN